MVAMTAILKDVLFGLRILRRNKWFTAVAVLTLGLGIAVNTTVFSWIHTVLLTPLPGVADSHELALIETVTRAASTSSTRPTSTTATTARI